MAEIPDTGSIPLAPGAHSSPRHGVCVVELASMLAGEEFSDRPRCVCPVIAAFLRGWNDRAAYADRQRLRPYAERIVGSRGDGRLTRERREICLRWAEAERPPRALRRRLRGLRLRFRIGVYCGLTAAVKLDEGAGEYAARVTFSRGNKEEAFGLLDALLAIGAKRPQQRPAVIIGGNGSLGTRLSERDCLDPGTLNGDGYEAVNGNRSTPNGNGHVAVKRGEVSA